MREADYGALAQFRYQLRTFLAFSEAAAQSAGLTPQQHQALLAIKGLAAPDGASVGDIARFLLIRHHTAVELVDRMAKLKLIGRESRPG
ncbi:DNA-binding MarR family transcriptional regulator [Bradyrhizobium sp. GM5.1]